MKRRAFLTAAGTTATITVSGCLGSGNDGEDNEPDVLQLGESVSHNGITVTLQKYHLANRYAVYRSNRSNEEQSFDENDWTEPPTLGGIFLCANLIIEHRGEDRLPIPPVEDPSGNSFTQSGGIYGSYDEDALNFFKPRDTFRANDRDYRSYHALVRNNEADERGVFPGVIFDAWLLTEVPGALKPEKLTISIQWGVEDDFITRTWNFGNKKPEVVPPDYQWEITTTNSSSE